MSGSGRVLVVEDEESFVDALTVGLTREGFTVNVARDGKEALDFFNAYSPDIVLLDVMLPLVSGVDVCRQIRTRSQVPIIMVTAKGEEIDAVIGLEVGADDYVTKPYRLRELISRMRSLLRRARWVAESEAFRGMPSRWAMWRWTLSAMKWSCGASRSTCRSKSSTYWSCCWPTRAGC